MIGFRILPCPRRVDAATIARFRALPVANVGDSMSRLFAAPAGLRPLHAGGVMAGPAFTVRTRPGDNLMVHKAIDTAAAGDVVVVDAGGALDQAIVGDLMLTHAIARGLGGMVIHGAVRDLDFIRGDEFPVYAAGVTHRGPYKDGPGEINVPITLGTMVVEPGDLVLGDLDGVLAVPFAAVAEVLEAALAKQAAEAKQRAELQAGTHDRSWVDKTLARLGCAVQEADGLGT